MVTPRVFAGEALRLVLLLGAAGACGEPPAPPASATAPDTGSIAVDNTTLSYTTEGAGRDCLVFGSRIYYPRTFSANFRSRLRCVHLDQRGFVPDAPTPSGGRYSVEVAVADIEAVRESLGLDRFVLVGHSMHGTVAMAYATAHPEHLAGVIAIGSPPAFDSGLTEAAVAYWNREASGGRMAADRRNLARLPLDSLGRLAPGAAVVATYIANAARYWADSTYDASWLWQGVEPNAALIGQLFDFTAPFRFPSTGPTSAVPVLLALGRFDFVVPPPLWESPPTVFQHLTKAVFGRSGHTPQLEEPAAFDATVAEWLDGLDWDGNRGGPR